MRVIGTAGHVDHGKSTLVAALTGTHPDRLKEEREREMTIDLGFAWLALPDGEPVGIVDVPGHRDFIENMLAGVGGIDAALLVVAADEGVMPQTREHLAILDLLQISSGVIVLTKVDLVDEPDWLDMVEGDVRQAVANTSFSSARMVRVSAKTGAGLAELRGAIQQVLASRPPRPNLNRPRLPIDRVFTLAGFGTIVTGTLIDGELQVGDEVEILPSGSRGRIRGLQSHKQKEDVAVPGGRTAVNLSGLSMEEVHRGEVLTRPGNYAPGGWLDVRFRLLPDASAPLSHSTELKLFIHTTEVLVRCRLLGKDVLQPGEEGWLQLELRQPVVAARGDHYILRRPSPGETLGGGIVVDPHPAGRHKRFAENVLASLETLAGGTPEEILLQAAAQAGCAGVREIAVQSRLDGKLALAAFQGLLNSGQLLALESGSLHLESSQLVITAAFWSSTSRKVQQEVSAYHAANPLRRGMPREQLKSRLKLDARPFNAFMRRCVEQGLVDEIGALIRLRDFTVQFTAAQAARMDDLLRQFAKAPYATPSVKECQQALGEDLYLALVDDGRLVQVTADVVFRKEDYDGLTQQVRSCLQEKGSLTVAEFRDLFQTSRKYALAFLENLDSLGVTVRDGDLRRLRKPA
jgi:selenocysteine-specific elongation factor